MNWLKNTITHGLSKKIILGVIMLAAVDMFSMSAPYYLKYVIPHVYTYLNLTQSEFDQLSATLGYVVLAFQIPSGLIADRMSGKKLLIISVIMSGILTVMFGLGTQSVYPSSVALPMMYVIFVGFGISTTLFLWSPLWKVLSEQGNKKQQSSLYGLQGSYNGVFGLIFITLIGTIATSLAKGGNNSLFYALLYIIAGALFLSAFGIHYFVKDTHIKSNLSKWFTGFKEKIKGIRLSDLKIKKLGQLGVLRVWLLAFFVLGMYVFQSIFAYYLKSYVALFISATVVAALAGFRTYGLRTVVSGPFGAWMKKRKSWVFVLFMTVIAGSMTSILLVLLPGVGNNIQNLSHGYKNALQIILPILFILVGISSWFLVAGRYMQIEEIPHTKANYGTTIALISFVAFSTDAWFYQMVSSWMESSGHVMSAAEATKLGGYAVAGGYDQAGLQMILFVALGVAGFGTLCGIGVYIINRIEIKKLKKESYRWRSGEISE